MGTVRLMGDGTGARDLYRKTLPDGREVYALRLDRVWRILGETSAMSALDAMDAARRAQPNATPAPAPRRAPIVRETSVDVDLGLVLRRPDTGPALYVQQGRTTTGKQRERVLCGSRLGVDAARQLAARPWPEWE
jgi:hypothetical protein